MKKNLVVSILFLFFSNPPVAADLTPEQINFVRETCKCHSWKNLEKFAEALPELGDEWREVMVSAIDLGDKVKVKNMKASQDNLLADCATWGNNSLRIVKALQGVLGGKKNYNDRSVYDWLTQDTEKKIRFLERVTELGIAQKLIKVFLYEADKYGLQSNSYVYDFRQYTELYDWCQSGADPDDLLMRYAKMPQGRHSGDFYRKAIKAHQHGDRRVPFIEKFVQNCDYGRVMDEVLTRLQLMPADEFEEVMKVQIPPLDWHKQYEADFDNSCVSLKAIQTRVNEDFTKLVTLLKSLSKDEQKIVTVYHSFMGSALTLDQLFDFCDHYRDIDIRRMNLAFMLLGPLQQPKKFEGNLWWFVLNIKEPKCTNLIVRAYNEDYIDAIDYLRTNFSDVYEQSCTIVDSPRVRYRDLDAFRQTMLHSVGDAERKLTRYKKSLLELVYQLTPEQCVLVEQLQRVFDQKDIDKIAMINALIQPDCQAACTPDAIKALVCFVEKGGFVQNDIAERMAEFSAMGDKATEIVELSCSHFAIRTWWYGQNFKPIFELGGKRKEILELAQRKFQAKYPKEKWEEGHFWGPGYYDAICDAKNCLNK